VNEPILIGAHLDHLGMSHELMPGANDNASAVSVAMAVAKALMESSVTPVRPIVFLLWGAEEQAVYGSRYYTENPIYPLESTVGYVNLESVGCGNIIRASAALNYPSFWSHIEEANNQYVHRIVRPNDNSYIARPRQDTAWFIWADVPSISFGVSGAQSFYHNTKDNIDTITPEILEDLAQIVFMAVTEMGSMEELDFRN
jgi:Zn-dependent M28 family amino/carboxypeptidase